MMNLGEFKSIGTHWMSLYVKSNDVTFLDSFGVKHISKEIKKFTENKNTIRNIYRIAAHKSIMRGYLCTGFINFMLEGKSLLDYTNLISPNEYEKKDKIRKYFH